MSRSMIFLKGFAQGSFTQGKEKGFLKTLNAINVATILHEGQMRKSGEPYFSHPVQVACELLALGVYDDILLASALLHDVLEDCGISENQLIHDYKIDPDVVSVVKLLTKSKEMNMEQYYKGIMSDWRASLIKISDRCHNVSTMVDGFDTAKMTSYVEETNQYVIPLCKYAKNFYPEYSNQVFVMKYHILSVCKLVANLIVSL